MCREDTLEDLLNDPVITLVMNSDRVRADEVRRLFDRVRAGAVPAPYMQPRNSGCLRPEQMSC